MAGAASNTHAPAAQPGTARLLVVAPAALVTYFFVAAFMYMPPLYFDALSAAARAAGGFYPADMYSQMMKYEVTAWIVGPILAGLLARRYGERAVWSAAQLGMVAVPLMLAGYPQPFLVKASALWLGLANALVWVGGISLIQMVPREKKGLSNGAMMATMGLGSLLGPVVIRALLYRQELGACLHAGNLAAFCSRLFCFTHMTTRLQVADFLPAFWLLAGCTLLSGLLVGLGGQRPGRFESDEAFDWGQILKDVRLLVRNPRFWALVLALSLLGSSVFQAANMYSPYRAEDLGLKSAGQDRGWIWWMLLQTLMWIPGGAAVGLVAGRRAPALAAVAVLAGFSLAALGIGLSVLAWQAFLCVACFEFCRQFMRWAQAGYLSEHLPGNLRAAAIGCSITLSGMGSAAFSWAANFFWNPDAAGFQSSRPFFAAAAIGLTGCLGLFCFDRFVLPIREPRPAQPAETTPAETPLLTSEGVCQS